MSTGIIRRLAEIALGSIVVRRRIPGKAGRGLIVVSGKVGGMKYLLKPSNHWDPELINTAALLVKKGGSIWDVGANIGLFSLASAFHAGSEGKVLCLEADIDAVALLNRTCRLLSPQHAPMTVVPVAVSKSDGFVCFVIAKRARAANSIENYGSTQTGGIAEYRTVPSVNLDKLLGYFPAPDILKIDVEGAEHEVLEGGRKILKEVHPVIYCEVSSRSNRNVSVLLRKHSYKLWDGSTFSDTSRPGILDCAHNTVAIPEEKVAEYCYSHARTGSSRY